MDQLVAENAARGVCFIVYCVVVIQSFEGSCKRCMILYTSRVYILLYVVLLSIIMVIENVLQLLRLENHLICNY